MSRIFIVYPSNLKHASRISKIASTLIRAGHADEVHVLGLSTGESETEIQEFEGGRVVWRRIAAFSPGSKLSRMPRIAHFAVWRRLIARLLRVESPSMICAHAVMVLDVCRWAANDLDVPLVYNAHELETETSMGQRRKPILRALERKHIVRADAITVVGHRIRDWYVAKYGIERVWVVRNIPMSLAHEEVESPLRSRVGVGKEELLFLMAGNLTIGRNIPAILKAWEGVDPDRHLVFMGEGIYASTIDACPLKNVHRIPPVPSAEVVRYASGADLGLCLIEDLCLSYRFSLPNKLFEYVGAGLAILASDLPEMAEFVQTNDLGWLTDLHPTALAMQVNALKRDEIEEKKRLARDLRKSLSWSTDEPALLAAIESAWARHKARS